MSEQKQTNEAVTTSQPAVQPQSERVPAGRKRKLVLLTVFFLLIALGCLLMYLLVWQHKESTDDAYVNGHLVQITPQITGTVQKVNVDDTQTVKAGQVLVELDNSDMQLAFERAHDELINAIRQNQQQTAQSRQASAQVAAQQAQLKRLQADLQRRQSLAGTDAISAEELSHARDAVQEAQANLKAMQGQESAAKAVLGHNVPLRQQPAVMTAVSHLKSAWLDLQRTQIKAPVDGQVAKRNVQVGQKVATGAALMAVVPLNNVWVDANFKESQLAKIRIGQPVEISADVYGSKVTYHGKVAGLSAGTGAAFSLLPAQNATGNWIKVVQRVPVRIALDPKELAAHPLRVGLSMDVEVNTRNQNGQDLTAANAIPTNGNMAAIDWTPINNMIEEIFAQYAP
ncbi:MULTISPECIES: efflux RND transporter periplasmic adaptor subunit [unclassified Snodgrassella]|uniref:efflux RND transporter periplasmic adaptor subunit n=1 Tax=unclassified Snodgrassella TaxID=2625236 RepID=UPI0018DE1ED1|nr:MULTISPECIES: efflux RND transporter periplasmic adaptor subunit [unclassified Snodgrassella]MBI0159764.1 efflux RND transporter periplasmic adaptor subunit [Snodgrassella sp. W6238H11]MBI0161925.1 efflux RND transporter periplasmic adaptor subunit [Snodgrassella sp. W6238H14]